MRILRYILIGLISATSFLFSQAKISSIGEIEYSEKLQSISSDDLTSAAGFNGIYNPGLLEQYAQRMESFLYNSGYLYGLISKINRRYNDDSSRVDLEIIGSSGKQVLIGDITIKSDSLLSEGYQNQLSIKKYDPFIPIQLETDINNLLLYAADSGYIYAEVHFSPPRVHEEDGDLYAAIEIVINEKDLARIDQIEINGNSYTKAHVILRELPVRLGDRYSKSDIDEIPRQLLRLGIFKDIKPPNLFISEQGRYILSVEVEEGNATTFDGVIGYIPEKKVINGKTKSSGYFTGLIDINFNNLFGTARRFSVHWEKPEQLSEFFALKYREPWFLDYPLHLGVGLERTVRDSTYIEWKTNFRAEWRYNRNLSFFSSVEKQVVLPDSVSNLVLRLARYEQYNIEAGITYDTRDYPINPRSGLFFENSYTFGYKNNFGPGYLLREDSIATHEELEVYKMHFKGFYELFRNQVFSFELVGNQVTGDRLQITDFFWFGGARTLRGYRENQFQGDFASWLKLEYRFLLARDSRIFIFNDWAAYHFKNKRIETDDVLYGYGIGIRLDTALGILAVDFGLGQDDDFSQAKIHFGIINRF